jgi:hypothetical protein
MTNYARPFEKLDAPFFIKYETYRKLFFFPRYAEQISCIPETFQTIKSVNFFIKGKFYPFVGKKALAVFQAA